MRILLILYITDFFSFLYRVLSGIVLELSKSLHNQGIMEQEHIVLAHDANATDTDDEVVLQLSENARTEGATTRSESVGSEVCSHLDPN